MGRAADKTFMGALAVFMGLKAPREFVAEDALGDRIRIKHTSGFDIEGNEAGLYAIVSADRVVSEGHTMQQAINRVLELKAPAANQKVA
jgi:hypothetical protein